MKPRQELKARTWSRNYYMILALFSWFSYRTQLLLPVVKSLKMNWDLLHQLAIKEIPHRHATGQTDQGSSSLGCPQVSLGMSNWYLKVNIESIWLSFIKGTLKSFASFNLVISLIDFVEWIYLELLCQLYVLKTSPRVWLIYCCCCIMCLSVCL